MALNIWGKLAQTLRGKHVIPAMPVGRRALLPGTDAEELITEEEDQSPQDVEATDLVGQSLPMPDVHEVIPMAIFIEYRDSKGALSERRVVCKTLDMNKGLLLVFCHERRAMRRFRLDRIISAWATDTGAEIDVATLPAQLIASGITYADERLVRVLTIMVYLMCCDGHLAQREVEMLEQIATSFVLRFGGDDTTVAHAAKTARVIAPTDRQFVLALHWAANHLERNALMAFIRRCAGQMVNADGHVALEEMEAGQIIDEVFRDIERGTGGN